MLSKAKNSSSLSMISLLRHNLFKFVHFLLALLPFECDRVIRGDYSDANAALLAWSGGHEAC